MIIKDEDIKSHHEKTQEKLYYVWDDTMKEITMNKNKDDTIIDIFYQNLVIYFNYKEIAALLNVAVQSVYNYNQIKGKSSQYNNNVRKQLATLFIDLLELYG